MHLFIAFEGGEGSGKTTQTRALYERIIQKEMPAVLTHEPGGSVLGEEARRWLKSSESITPLAELFLFAAARAQLVSEVILPSLEKGIVVICDRYEASSIAYQGHGRGLDAKIVQKINDIATRGLHPDLIVLLDLPAEEGLRRKSSKERDRFEREDIEFHRRVREGYLKRAAAEPERWFAVDASLPAPKISQLIWERVQPLLNKG